MNEGEPRAELCNRIKKELTGYRVFDSGRGTNLIYQIIIDEKGETKSEDTAHHARGTYAFQTDIVIKNEKVPLVAIETKFGSLTTHDVLTYSAKATRHKGIYPYLRYGLVAGNLQKIPNRLFVHNQGFDFAASLKDINDEHELKLTMMMVEEQVRDAEKLLGIMEKRRGARMFAHRVEVEI